MAFCEAKVRIKDDEQKLDRSFPIYEGALVEVLEFPQFHELVKIVRDDFKGDPKDHSVEVVLKYVVE